MNIIHKQWAAPRISSQGWASLSEITFKRVDCKRGVYLIPTGIRGIGHHIHFDDPKDTKSQGYGGSVLEFRLEDGSIYSAKGPWRCAHSYLLADTGIDLSQEYVTRVAIANFYSGDSYDGTQMLYDVVYLDPEEGVLGKYDRYKDLITQFPDAGLVWVDSFGARSMLPQKKSVYISKSKLAEFLAEREERAIQ